MQHEIYIGNNDAILQVTNEYGRTYITVRTEQGYATPDLPYSTVMYDDTPCVMYALDRNHRAVIHQTHLLDQGADMSTQATTHKIAPWYVECHDKETDQTTVIFRGTIGQCNREVEECRRSSSNRYSYTMKLHPSYRQ
jgi:hypothetical protein